MTTRIKSIFTNALLACACIWMQAAAAGATAAYYVPYTLELNSAPRSQGVWVADASHPGSAPSQVTAQVLDGPSGANVAVLNYWKYSAGTREAGAVTPALMIFGQGGHLFSYGLSGGGTLQAFSNGTYTALCGLTALNQQPYTGAGSPYVVAVVVPGSGDCATGAGVQTWLIPGTANAGTAPIVKPANWRVLGAFTDPSTGNFLRWVVWTGAEVATYRSNFSGAITVLKGLPAGAAPAVLGRLNDVMFLLSSTTSGGVVTDQLFYVVTTGSSHIANHVYSASAPCAGLARGRVMDAAKGLLAYAEPTDQGYAVFTAPISGGIPSAIYADASGARCGEIAGDGVSASHVALYELQLAGLHRAIGVSESGPVDQVPVVLAGDANTDAFPRYTIGGHLWIDLASFPASGGGAAQSSEVVMDGDGRLLASYPGAQLAGDRRVGFAIDGRSPGIDRDRVYLFYPAGGDGACSGGALLAYDPVSFAQTSVTGLPADACALDAYGWQSAGLGGVSEGAGNAAIEIDPVAGRLYLIAPPQNLGVYTSLLTPAGFPFY